MSTISSLSQVHLPTDAMHRDKALREAAVQLEATFLAEMLNTAGLGSSRAAFGGGAGEDQFGSMLVREQALQMARAGGIGLAETIFNALKGRDDE